MLEITLANGQNVKDQNQLQGLILKLVAWVVFLQMLQYDEPQEPESKIESEYHFKKWKVLLKFTLKKFQC